jgi:DsbC/DsbD-like thiol-disulfide interchange protein
MKRLFFLAMLAMLSIGNLKAQILKPVTWSYAAKKTGPGTATLFIKATIADGWHLYSQFVKEGGPLKTSFTFPSGSGYVILGKTIEPKPITKYESTFEMNVGYFEKSVIFQQKVKFSKKNVSVKGIVEFMVCNDKQCLPPEEVAFKIDIK